MSHCSGPDLHALFSLLDKDDRGAVDIGEFTRNYQAGRMILTTGEVASFILVCHR